MAVSDHPQRVVFHESCAETPCFDAFAWVDSLEIAWGPRKIEYTLKCSVYKNVDLFNILSNVIYATRVIMPFGRHMPYGLPFALCAIFVLRTTLALRASFIVALGKRYIVFNVSLFHQPNKRNERYSP